MPLTAAMTTTNNIIQLNYIESYLSAPITNLFYNADLMLFAFALFIMGLLAMIFNSRNFLVIMVAAELMYLGAIISFAFYGLFIHTEAMADSVCTALLLLILAAAETALGLGVLIVLHRFGGAITLGAYTQLRG